MGSVKQPIEFKGVFGECGQLPVFLGFASSSLLYRLSFADILDEKAGTGYQRRINTSHSLSFRKYIQEPRATTIPLTLNLRHPSAGRWTLQRQPAGQATLSVASGVEKVFAQVDCQHRLGYLADLDIPLAFMTFIGLTPKEEMEVFNTINGKAKGLSTSLVDYHEATLHASNLAVAKPELYLAMQLHERPASPWFQRLDMGGSGTVGLKRYASLRTMQKAARRFLKNAQLPPESILEAVEAAINFWRAISLLLPSQWNEPRSHLLTKGIGVYALMSLAGDIAFEARARGHTLDERYFCAVLSDFIGAIDWSNRGPMQGFGGVAGADKAYELVAAARNATFVRLRAHG